MLSTHDSNNDPSAYEVKWVNPVRSSKKEDGVPHRSKSEDRLSSSKNAKENIKDRDDDNQITDGFDAALENEKIKIKSLETVGTGDSSFRSRKPSVSSIFKDGVTRFLRTLTTVKQPKLSTKVRSSSIIYLGNQGQTKANTGFAFSQDAGVSSAVETSPER